MEFLYPSFLWAMLLLAIPIIVHLFYFRRFKKVAFTNVRLLEEIKEETSSRNKLRDLLILLSRLLALGLLIAAFAQPYLPKGNEVKAGNNAVSIFIDNSFSMRAESSQTPLIDIAKEKARQILAAYSESDVFQIITHDLEGRHQRMVPKEDAINLIDEIELSPAVEPLSIIMNRQKQAMDAEGENKIAYLLSDFQSSIVDELDTDTLIEHNFIPVRSVQENNIVIDTAFLEAGLAFLGQDNILKVKLRNYGTEEADNVRLSILKDGQERPEGQYTIPADGSIEVEIVVSILQPGWHRAVVKISDYPVQFDDSYYISFYVDESLEVLVLSDAGENRYLRALFGGLSTFDVSYATSTRLDYSKLNDYRLIILHDINGFTSGLSTSLKQYVAQGGKLLLFPSKNENIQSINNFLNSVGGNNLVEKVSGSKIVGTINTDEFIFKEVFQQNSRNITLPESKENYKLTRYQSRPEETLMTYRDGSPYLVKYDYDGGIVYLCAAPIDRELNTLVLNAEIFVPMIYKMSIASAYPQPLSYVIGSNTPIEVNRSNSSGDITYNITGAVEFIPAQINADSKVLLSDNDQISEAGWYDLRLKEKQEKLLSYNYDRQESDMRLAPVQSLSESGNLLPENLDADFTTIINEKDKGITLWRWCLILALAFLILETLLLRFWKK